MSILFPDRSKAEVTSLTSFPYRVGVGDFECSTSSGWRFFIQFETMVGNLTTKC